MRQFNIDLLNKLILKICQTFQMHLTCNLFLRITHRSANVYNTAIRKTPFVKTLDFPAWNSLLKTYGTGAVFAQKPKVISTITQLQNHNQLDAFKLNYYSTKVQNESPKNIDSHVKSAKAALKKIKRKNTVSQKSKAHVKPGRDAWSVVGYATAESYDLYNLARRLALQVI